MRGLAAAERLVKTLLRVFRLALSLIVGELTMLAAVLVSCLSPVAAGSSTHRS